NVDKTMLTALPYVVERDEWFVLGDNRSVSIDSRNFGPIQRQQVFGKAFVLTTANVGGLFRALQLVTLLVLLAVFARKIYNHISS
ncbi:MAG TPA: S26 family signal peptidase, partial [Metalysinibacillus sp.]